MEKEPKEKWSKFVVMAVTNNILDRDSRRLMTRLYRNNCQLFYLLQLLKIIKLKQVSHEIDWTKTEKKVIIQLNQSYKDVAREIPTPFFGHKKFKSKNDLCNDWLRSEPADIQELASNFKHAFSWVKYFYFAVHELYFEVFNYITLKSFSGLIWYHVCPGETDNLSKLHPVVVYFINGIYSVSPHIVLSWLHNCCFFCNLFTFWTF